ncbi:MAG: DUF4168 domain-containing protein [Cyanobacteria bacterium P01_D01_bin.71]
MTNTLVKNIFRQPLPAAKLLTVGLLSSWLGIMGLPIAPTAHLSLAAQAAVAQTGISNEEITQYARAVLAIDQYRNTAYTEIKDILLTVEMDISDINVSCTNTQDVSEVPRSVRRDVREIITSYCNQSRKAVEDNDLSPRRFNEITQAHGSDQTVFERIQQELLRLQQN